MSRRRALVFGATGQLGTAVCQAFANCAVTAPPRASLDLCDPEAVSLAVREVAPEIIINCAAFNDVDGAEDQPARAFEVNALVVRSLALASEVCRATLVHYSTDFVFDGERTNRPYSEGDAPAPRSVYAMSKLVGEWFALQAPGAFVLRVESLFGTPRRWAGRLGTLERLAEGLEREQGVRVFSDRVVSPSYIVDVAQATRHLVLTAATPGLYHCVNSGQATWLEVAQELERQLGVSAPIEVVSVDQVEFRAARPRFCALANDKIGAAGFPMPTWQDAIERWMATRDRPAA